MEPRDLRQIYGQRYYDAQLLEVADFERERDFHVALDELRTRLTLAPGILIGLEVRARQGGRVLVGPGAAVDEEGRLVLLTDRARAENGSASVAPAPTGMLLDLSAPPLHGKRVAVGLRWGRVPDPAEAGRTVAEPVFTVHELADGEEGPGPGVVEIARAEITATPQAAPPADPPGSPPPKPPPPIVKVSLDPSTRVAATLLPERLPPREPARLDPEQIPDLPAAKITGSLTVDQLPELPAAKIAGPLTVEQIPDLPAAKIAGPLTVEQLPELPAAKIAGPLTVEQIPDLPATKIAGPLTVDQVPDLPAAKISGPLTVEQIPDLPATKVAGPLTVEQLPERIPVARLEGALPSDRIEGLAAEKITGTLSAEQVAGLPASKITGRIGSDQIEGLDVAKLVGDLDVHRIAGLDALLAAHAAHASDGGATLFGADPPVLERPGPVTLHWQAAVSGDLTIVYTDLQAVRTLSSSAGELTGSSHSLDLSQTTTFTLTSHKDGVVTAHAQLVVIVAPTVEAIVHFLGERGLAGSGVTEQSALTEAVVPVVEAFELQALAPRTVRLLAGAFHEAGVPLAATFRGLTDYFEHQWLPGAYTPVVMAAYGMG